MTTSSDLPTEGDPTDARAVAPTNVPPPYTQGSTVDDDGIAIDEYFEAMPSSPIPRDYLGADVVDLIPTTRMVTSSFMLQQAQQVMALPPDPNRVGLNISCNVPDAVYAISNEKINPLVITSVYPVASSPDFSKHTGAVWIMNVDNSPDARFYVQAITL